MFGRKHHKNRSYMQQWVSTCGLGRLKMKGSVFGLSLQSLDCNIRLPLSSQHPDSSSALEFLEKLIYGT